MGWLSTIGAIGGRLTTAAWFLDVAVKAALVLLVALLVTRTLRRASASTRHQVWTVALVCVLALPALTGLLPAWRVAWFPTVAALSPNAAVASTGAPDTMSAPAKADSFAESTPGTPGSGAAMTKTKAVSTEVPSATRPPSGDDQGVALATAASFDFPHWQALLIVVWLAGSAVLMTRVVMSSLAAWWVVRRADPIDDVTLRAEALDVQRELGMGTDVRLAQSGAISMPMAWGVLSPAVLLSSESATWSHARRRVVLLHEMAHLKRRDCQILLLARMVTALHWFNPLAWLATQRLQAEQERACDDLVLSMGTRAPDYAQHLLDIARAVRASASPHWAAVAMARPNELESRLLAILDPDMNRRRTTRAATLAGLLGVGLLVFPLAALQARAVAEPEPREVERLAQQIAARLDANVLPRLENQIELQLEPQAEIRRGDDLGVVLEDPPPEATGRVSQNDGGLNPRVLEAFLTALRDEEPGVRAQAAASLGELEAPQAVAALSELLQSDEDADVRSRSAWALGMIEDDSSVRALSAALRDADVDVREQAAWALGMIESATAVDELIAAASDEEEGVRGRIAWALGMIESSAAVDALSVMLRGDESADVRQQAAWAMGMIEDEAALDALLDAMTDENVEVRKKVLWAVGQIAG